MAALVTTKDERIAQRLGERLAAQVQQNTHRPLAGGRRGPPGRVVLSFQPANTSAMRSLTRDAFERVVQGFASSRGFEVEKCQLGYKWYKTPDQPDPGDGHYEGVAEVRLRDRPSFRGSVLRNNPGGPTFLLDGRIREDGEAWAEGARVYRCLQGEKLRDTALERRYRTNPVARFFLGPLRPEPFRDVI
jgi:hypothetical protein